MLSCPVSMEMRRLAQSRQMRCHQAELAGTAATGGPGNCRQYPHHSGGLPTRFPRVLHSIRRVPPRKVRREPQSSPVWLAGRQGSQRRPDWPSLGWLATLSRPRRSRPSARIRRHSGHKRRYIPHTSQWPGHGHWLAGPCPGRDAVRKGQPLTPVPTEMLEDWIEACARPSASTPYRPQPRRPKRELSGR